MQLQAFRKRRACVSFCHGSSSMPHFIHPSMQLMSMEIANAVKAGARERPPFEAAASVSPPNSRHSVGEILTREEPALRPGEWRAPPSGFSAVLSTQLPAACDGILVDRFLALGGSQAATIASPSSGRRLAEEEMALPGLLGGLVAPAELFEVELPAAWACRQHRGTLHELPQKVRS